VTTEPDIAAGTGAERIEREAADWLARLDRDGRLDGASDLAGLMQADAAFAAWVEASVNHRVAALRLLAAWQQADRLSALGGGEPAMPRPIPHRRLPRGAGLALAACLALVVALAALSGGAVLFYGGRPENPPIEMRYQTGVGMRDVAVFADGSRVELNTATLLRTTASDQVRHVDLVEGEAYFDIARNEALPFVVDAGTTRITVLGTEFSVHRTPQGIELMVLEGSVRLESGLGGDDEHVSLVLEAGAVARTGGDRSVLVERRGLDRLARDTAWREGQLYFDETRLADVAAEFNRYNHTHLVIADPDIADIPVGGTFRADNVEGFARLLQDGMGLSVERQGAELVISS
jgi:transmembrane sensor